MGASGKDRQAVNRGQRLVGVDAVRERHLAAHGDGVDGLVSGVEVQSVEAVEELELDAATPQCLVQRGDDDIAHPGGHLPEDRALVAEEHEADEERHHPRRHRGLAGFGLLVAEHQVVQPADQR